MPKLPEAHRPVFLAALEDLDRYRMLEKPLVGTGNRKGIAARRDQWMGIRGGRLDQGMWWWMGGGASIGAVVMFVVGVNFAEFFEQAAVVCSVLGVPAGGYIGRMLKTSAGWDDGMMRVVVNERRSSIRRELVTAQAEAWAPKALLSWRMHDWRWKDDEPYLWLQLPFGARIHTELHGTLSYLRLPRDPYHARDAAVFAKRSRNRRVSDAALDHADAFDDEMPEENMLKALVPWMVPAIEVTAGVLVVLFTLD